MSLPLLTSAVVSICVLAQVPTWTILGHWLATTEIVDTVNVSVSDTTTPLLLRTIDDDGRVKDSISDSLFQLPENP